MLCKFTWKIGNVNTERQAEEVTRVCVCVKRAWRARDLEGGTGWLSLVCGE